MKKKIQIEGLKPMSVAEYNLYKVMSVILFPVYAAAYGIAHLFKIKGCEDMESFLEWFDLFTKDKKVLFEEN